MVAKRAAADQLDPAFLSQIDFPIVKRGFDPASVQAFAEAVGIEMSRLLEENQRTPGADSGDEESLESRACDSNRRGAGERRIYR